MASFLRLGPLVKFSLNLCEACNLLNFVHYNDKPLLLLNKYVDLIPFLFTN